MPIVISISFRRRACGSSLCMGRGGGPDMAMYIFARAISQGQPIKLFNYGRMRRDFTYVDDVVAGIERLIGKPPKMANAAPGSEPDPAKSSVAPWRIYNIGNNTSVEVSYVVELLERELGRKAKVELAEMQPGDVPETRAEVDDLMDDVGFRPSTTRMVSINSWHGTVNFITRH